MMAKTLNITSKAASLLFRNSRVFNACIPQINHEVTLVRSLYCKSTLGLDTFEHQREKISHQMINIEDKFKDKMKEYVLDESKNMIFTEDLKNMIHLSKNDEDVNLVVQMMKRFNQQNKQVRFGSYIFGPVVMRLFYTFNKVDLAYECFHSKELDGFFDQLMSYQVLLDLLYENQKYNEILETYKVIYDRQIEGTKFPRNIIVLALAACYKLNSSESLDFALKLWKDVSDAGHFPMRRATTFCAGLALNQNKPEIAIEILSSARNQNYVTVRNLRVAALADLGRVDDAIPIMKSIISEDLAVTNVHTFNRDVIEKVKKAVEASDNSEVTLEFNRLEQALTKQGQISETSLDELLCSEIQKPPMMNNRQDYKNQNYQNQRNFDNRSNNRQPYQRRGPQRPGLEELL